jgi:hypothetical protein
MCPVRTFPVPFPPPGGEGVHFADKLFILIRLTPKTAHLGAWGTRLWVTDGAMNGLLSACKESLECILHWSYCAPGAGNDLQNGQRNFEPGLWSLAV